MATRLASPSIREVLRRSMGRDLRDMIPTISLLRIPQEILRNPTTASSSNRQLLPLSKLLELPLELLLRIFEVLPILERHRLARCCKLLAKLATNEHLFDTHSYANPIYTTYRELKASLCVNDYNFSAAIREDGMGSRIVHLQYQTDTGCSRCGWQGSFASLNWFRHLEMELCVKGVLVTKGVLQAITYEVLKQVFSRACHLHSRSVVMVGLGESLFADEMLRAIQEMRQADKPVPPMSIENPRAIGDSAD